MAQDLKVAFGLGEDDPCISTGDAGRGMSPGRVYTVTGTIGQSDARGAMTSAKYSVTGGFWALPILLQTPNAPTLHLTNAGFVVEKK